MRTLVIFLILSLVPLQWGNDLDAAKKLAHDQNKLILLNFSGSDWCAPCILTRRDYFESETFMQMANENLVLVNADFPRKKKNQLPADQAKKNDALAEKYNKEGNFPYTLLLDANGNVLRSWKGKPEVPVDKWVAEIKGVCLNRKK